MFHALFNVPVLTASTSISHLFSRPLEEPIVIFALLMTLILIIPLISRLIRLPEIVGLIIAGIALGPHALNILPNGGAVELLGQVGLIYIMFQAGIEIDMNGFEENRSHSVIFGVLSYAFPMVMGAGLIWVFLHNQLNHDHLWPTILLLASVFASHTLLSQPIIKRLDIMKDPAVTTAVGGTIVTDTLTLMTLAIIAALVQGDANAKFWLILFSGIAIYSLAVWLIVPRLSRWVFSKFKEGSVERFVYILTIVFICATLAEVANMEGIIGAFFAGIAVNRLVPERSPLAVRIDFVGETLFIPMFMVTVGMIVDVHSLLDPTMWTVAGVILGSVFVAKILAVFGSAKLFQYTNDQAMVIFGLCVSQAAATLAATFVGYKLGLFNDTILNSIIMLILVTCILSPIITEHWGRKVAENTESISTDPSKAPQRLLVPLANPATTESLMNIAILLHNPKSDEPLYPLTVAMDGDDVEAQVAQGEKNLERAVKLVTEANLGVSPVTRVDLNVADGIIRAITELRIRTVLIGWNGQVSTDQLVFGSILDRLLKGTEQTLFVYKPACPASQHKRVLLAIPPFSTRLPGFIHALTEVWTLCTQLGAQLHIITPSDTRLSVEKSIARSRQTMNPTWVDIPTWDNMLPALQQSAKPEEDLIILMASRKHTISWTRDNDRLPRQLALRFPSNSFMVVYPRNQRIDSSAQRTLHQLPTLRRLVHQGGAPLTLTSLQDSDAIAEIAEHLPNHIQGENLAKLLLKSARVNSVRVIQGIVLIDAHDPEIPRSFISVSTAQSDPIMFQDLREPVQQIWILVTGSDMTEEEHEDIFGSINQSLQRHTPTELTAVQSEADVARILGS